jgi:hypothetical protein
VAENGGHRSIPGIDGWIGQAKGRDETLEVLDAKVP